ncbi:MAG: fumarate hydratase [Polyangia bacterium]|jgi:fumarate hydratase class I|nr:fumarate hydratase [Polyangia bacterium]
MEKKLLKPAMLELIRRASCDLPPDVEEALSKSRKKEEKGSIAREALDVILENVSLARAQSTPICQDTGTNLYFVEAPLELPEAELRAAILGATRLATKKGYLRPNVVNPVTGKNTGDNVGIENPQIHWHQHAKKSLRVSLMLKGGGCENVSIQYTLPDKSLGAGRDLEGVFRTVVDSAHRAQGKGCAPGIFGVGVGGDRLSSYLVAKEQLLRVLGDKNPDPALHKLERRCLDSINALGVGPMGFGGQTTALGVKIGIAHRLPASYFVSIAYMCWACRRMTLTLGPDGAFKVAPERG